MVWFVLSNAWYKLFSMVILSLFLNESNISEDKFKKKLAASGAVSNFIILKKFFS
jgi:hypothetical protein